MKRFLFLIPLLALVQLLLWRCDAAWKSHCVVSSSLYILQSDLTIHIFAKKSMAVSITISNLIGIPVVEFRRLFLSKGRNKIDIRRFNLSPGIYILVLNGDNIHLVSRIIIKPID